ncbi:MAG TPA: hypothetical protein VLZ11_04200 [Flavobacterium sp.]|nr:hypothetical protein [Flavobacterium sp.]
MMNYLKNWNFTRVLRLVMGIFIVVQGFINQEWFFVILGALFTLMPLLNIGCGSAGCAVPKQTTANKKPETITYEEIQK